MSAFTATGPTNPLTYKIPWVAFYTWNFGYTVTNKAYDYFHPLPFENIPNGDMTQEQRYSVYASEGARAEVEGILFFTWAVVVGLLVGCVDWKIRTGRGVK